MVKPAKNTICLWYNGDAENAARFYAKTFPDSSVEAVHRAPGDYPSGKKGDVMIDGRVYRDGRSVPRAECD
jgi:2-polyprenyl-6-hydroxyphenyl methylase/3-demethylubiquinone-9 3-methyltransferase